MIKMEDKNVIAGLERTYRTMNPSQYIREIYQNSVEAGATDIRFIMDKLAHRSLGVRRGVGLDNGPGIPKDQILQLINNKNSSSKKVGGEEDNFGVGLKVSALPRNKYGLVVLSRTEEHPEGFMIWMAYEEDENGEVFAGAKELTSEENYQDYYDDGEIFIEAVVDFAEVKERNYDSYTIDGIDWLKWWSTNRVSKRHTTGTAVIMLGNHEEENTFASMGLEGRRFLHSRYLTFDPVQPRFPKNSGERAMTSESLTNPVLTLEKRAEGCWNRNFKGYTIYVYLLRTIRDARAFSQNTHNYTPLARCNSFVEAIVYKNEVYGDFDTLGPQARAAQSRSWGLWSNKVAKRITILVEPPAYTAETKHGVYPNEARSMLSWKESEDAQPSNVIPMDELKAFFQKNMPEEIKDLLHEAALEDIINVKKSKSAEELNKWMKIPRDKRRFKKGNGLLLAHKNGIEFGSHLSQDLFGKVVDPKNNKPNPKPNPDPNIDTKPKEPPTEEELKKKEEKRKAREAQEKKRMEPPKVVFIRQKHEDAEGRFKINGLWQSAFYQPPSASGEEGNILWINQDHNLFYGYVNAASEWLQKKNKPMTDTAIVQHIVKPFWEEYAPCAIQHAKSLPNSKRDKDTFSPERLTWLFLGSIHHMIPKINSYYKNYQKIANIA